LRLETFKDLTSSIESDVSKLTIERDNLKQIVQGLISEREPRNYNVERVQLDIGGYHYSTSVNTLTTFPGTYFGRLFGETFPTHLVGTDGRIFLDRDGRHFRYILNFLRDPENFVLKLKGKDDRDDLREEAKFYGIEQFMFKTTVFEPEKTDWIDPLNIKLVDFSTEHSDRFPATNVLDYSRTYWLSLPGTITDQWLTFDFKAEAVITKIAIKVDNFECTVKDFSIQYIEDDDYKTKDWINIKDFQAQVGNSNTGDQYFDGFEFRARYMRIFCKNNWGPGGGNFILITNIKFFGAINTDS